MKQQEMEAYEPSSGFVKDAPRYVQQSFDLLIFSELTLLTDSIVMALLSRTEAVCCVKNSLLPGIFVQFLHIQPSYSTRVLTYLHHQCISLAPEVDTLACVGKI